MKRFKIDGYGQLELNFASFRRAGQIEAQCHLGKIPALDADGAEIYDDNGDVVMQTIPYIENGMFLAIDHAKRTVNFPVDGEEGIYALNYTTEHMYDERQRGLKHFRLEANGPLPRMGYPNKGDKWTTNCLAYDNDMYSEEVDAKDFIHNALTEGTTLYGRVNHTGALEIVNAKDEYCVAKVVKETTMPDGQWAIQFVAL